MTQSFTHTILGKTGLPVFRLGLAATYRPGKETIYKAVDEGINFFFFFGMDYQMISALRDVLRHNREKYVIATGPPNLLGHGSPKRCLEKRLRQLKTDYIDCLLFLGVTKEKYFPEKAREEFYRLREQEKVKAVGLSTHNRKFAGKLCAEGAIDVIMMRYNAAHRGAEQDIFPYLTQHNPGVIGYTATRWTYLIRRPKNWPKDERIPTPGMCYRFVLTNPNVHVCLTSPRNLKELQEDLASLKDGPLSEEDIDFMRKFGDVVHHTKKWFM